MTTQCLSHKWVRTRKEHRCVACELRIRKGARVIKNVGVFEGEFYSHYYHPVCYDALDECMDDMYDELPYAPEFRQDVLGLPLLKGNP